MNNFKNKPVALLLVLSFVSTLFATDNLSIINNPFLYSAAYKDKENPLQYLNSRYYDPDIRRFVSRDSYDLPNRYHYAGDNPIMNDDPSGHLSHAELGIIIGVSAVALISLSISGYLFWRNRLMAQDITYIQLNELDQASINSVQVSDSKEENLPIWQQAQLRIEELHKNAEEIEAENKRFADNFPHLRDSIHDEINNIRALILSSRQ